MRTGQTIPGAVAKNLDTDHVYTRQAIVPRDQRLAAMGVYLDGQGPADAGGRLRGVLRDDSSPDHVIAVGDEVIIPADAPAGWVELPMTPAAGLELLAGTYWPGIHIGGVDHALRTFVDDPSADHAWEAPDVYADGTALSIVPGWVEKTWDLPIFLATFDPVILPANVDDAYLARLPWELAQQAFSATAPIRTTRTSAIAGWHHTPVDVELGANAIVRTGGPLDSLVGERLKITRQIGAGARQVYVYCHEEQVFPDELAGEDLSLTRRAWLELAPWALDELKVYVEVMA